MSPVRRIMKIAAWSYSRLSDYLQCPFKTKCKVIDKMKEPDSPAGKNGTRIHVLAAAWATNKVPALDRQTEEYRSEVTAMLKKGKVPEELAPFKKEFDALRKRQDIQVEAQWTFNVDWEITGWFDKDAWLRIKVDLHYLVQEKKGKKVTTGVVIRDHKTGKQRADHDLQRSLYALGAFLQYPDAEWVEASHWYLDPGLEGGPERWTRAQLPALQAEWLKRTHGLLNDTSFAPRPGAYCQWCVASKAKGGPCRY